MKFEVVYQDRCRRFIPKCVQFVYYSLILLLLFVLFSFWSDCLNFLDLAGLMLFPCVMAGLLLFPYVIVRNAQNTHIGFGKEECFLTQDRWCRFITRFCSICQSTFWFCYFCLFWTEASISLESFSLICCMCAWPR